MFLTLKVVATQYISKKNEPGIWATNRRGAMVENIVMSEQGEFDFDDDSICENVGVPILSFIDSDEPSHAGGVPKDMVAITADAFGVLPPVSS